MTGSLKRTIPAVVTNSKRVFLTNGGGSNLAYDAFYTDIKQWGRYEIVGLPEEADLIIELAYKVEHGGTRVWSSTNTYNGATQVYSAQIVDPQLVLNIYDAKTKQPLWSEVDHRRLARMEHNRGKETITEEPCESSSIKQKDTSGITGALRKRIYTRKDNEFRVLIMAHWSPRCQRLGPSWTTSMNPCLTLPL